MLCFAAPKKQTVENMTNNILSRDTVEALVNNKRQQNPLYLSFFIYRTAPQKPQ
jgi:hypothetical protein